MSPFEKLPEGCISEILSFTSASDVSRSSTVSKEFKLAAESDEVWRRFLPSDCEEIISTSVSPLKYDTKKHLYFNLCHSPLLIDGGKMSFSLHKRNGKKCFLVGARELMISWKSCWDFTSNAKSRFSEVARLRSVGWIHIQGKIRTQILSPNTTYAAHLVFFMEKIDGLKSSNTVIRFMREQSKDNTSNENIGSRETGKIAQRRGDGWLEIELGKFFINGQGDNGIVEAWLVDINCPYGMSGLEVEGIEFRPV